MKCEDRGVFIKRCKHNGLKLFEGADDMTTLKTIRIFSFAGIIIVHVCLTYALMPLSNLFFRRQLRKHGAPLDYGALPPGTAPGAGPHPEHNGAVFGVSGGVGEGSMRGAFRQQQQQILTAKSPAGRLAVNELFGNHGIAGPPLPRRGWAGVRGDPQQPQLGCAALRGG